MILDSLDRTTTVADMPALAEMGSYTSSAGKFNATEILRERYHNFDQLGVPTASVKSKIRKLSTLEENWDGRGSAKPTTGAINQALLTLDNCYTVIRNNRLSWSTPHISATEEGEVTMEWWFDSKKLSLYVSDDCVEYIKVWGSDINNEMEDGELRFGMFFDLWNWLTD